MKRQLRLPTILLIEVSVDDPVDFDGLIARVNRIKDYWFGIALLPEG